MDKREFLKNISLLSAGALVKPSLANGFFDGGTQKWELEYAPFKLPALDFSFNALEPYIDALTMEIHHDKHHAAYVANLNKAVEGSEFAKTPLEIILASIKLDSSVQIRNNGGGHYNHTFFWKQITPNSRKQPIGKLAKAIDEQFGSFEKFKEQFEGVAKGRFGSGWAWLSLNRARKLFISSTPNQDSPIMWDLLKEDEIGFPIMGLDVWEHAYYLRYQNRRPDYISAFWNVVNWEFVENRYWRYTEG